MTKATGTKTTKSGDEEKLRDIAEKLGVNYYSGFRVVKAKEPGLTDGSILYFPIAEVYEEGSWETVVIGGRPYVDYNGGDRTAKDIVSDAEKTQRVFLEIMSEHLEHEHGYPNGLTNPVDNWKYETINTNEQL